MKNVLNFLLIALLATTVNAAIAGVEPEGDVAKLKVEVIEHKKQMVAVHYAVQGKGAVSIKIMDADSEHIVYVEKEYRHQLAVKKYDLSYLPKGEYLVEVSYDGETFKKRILL